MSPNLKKKLQKGSIIAHARELCGLSLKFLFLGSIPRRSLFPRPKVGPGNQYFGFEKPLFIDGFSKKK